MDCSTRIRRILRDGYQLLFGGVEEREAALQSDDVGAMGHGEAKGPRPTRQVEALCISPCPERVMLPEALALNVNPAQLLASRTATGNAY